MNRLFYVKAYKAEGTYYGAAGQTVGINCNFLEEGVYGLNAAGQEVPIPHPETGGPNKVMVPHATEFPNATQPYLDLKTVTKIKDMVTDAVYWVDTADFNVKKVQCNPVPYATSCPPLTNISAGTPGATTATITFTQSPALAGIEYVNNTSAGAPAGDGTFLPVGTTTINLTGLTTATTYYFHARTICTGGVRSAWQVFSYTTA